MSEEAKQNDSELNDLLDDALHDFDNQHNCSNDAKQTDKNESDVKQKEQQSMQEFLSEQAQALTECMSAFFVDSKQESSSASDTANSLQKPGQLVDSFKKMADAAALILQGKSDANVDEVAKYSNIIGHTLKSLQKGQDNLEVTNSGTDKTKTFSGLNLEHSDSSGGNVFLPFMEGMMQSLLSSEVILPVVKDLLDKYPKYLTENADKLSAEDIDRYNKQLELYKAMAQHLTVEQPSDTPKQKREQFQLVLDDIRKLQDYGEAPQEVFAEIAGGLPLLDPAALVAPGGDPKLPVPHDILKNFFPSRFP